MVAGPRLAGITTTQRYAKLSDEAVMPEAERIGGQQNGCVEAKAVH